MPGRLTTHVLDLCRGGPAAGVEVELWLLAPGGEGRRLLKTFTTNRDGRTDEPLLEGESFEPGCYELVFAIGAYFGAPERGAASPPFLDRVPVRFGIADRAAHYHVPLLASPWSYTTYRGS